MIPSSAVVGGSRIQCDCQVTIDSTASMRSMAKKVGKMRRHESYKYMHQEEKGERADWPMFDNWGIFWVGFIGV